MSKDLVTLHAHDHILRRIIENDPICQFSLASPCDRLILAKIARELPPRSIVVEVGTYLGAAMAVMSKFNSKIEIHAFDLFDQGKYDSEHHQLLEQALGPGKSRTMEHVAEFLTAYSNIHLHQVTVDEYVEFDHAIDVFVEDSSHCNPQLRRSLDTWMPGIRSGGLALIHDYRPWRDSGDLDRFPDVESEVERLAADSEWDFLGQLNNVDLGEFGSYAVFQKL